MACMVNVTTVLAKRTGIGAAEVPAPPQALGLTLTSHT
jgi:hypothetical protein